MYWEKQLSEEGCSPESEAFLLQVRRAVDSVGTPAAKLQELYNLWYERPHFKAFESDRLCKNRSTTDFRSQVPDSERVVVVNLSLKYCGKTFKRYFRYKCGHAYERIFYLAYFTMYPDCVYFYSKNLLWNE